MRRMRATAVVLAMVAFGGCGVPGFLKVGSPPDGTTVKKLSADLDYGGDEPGAAADAGTATGPRIDVHDVLDPLPGVPTTRRTFGPREPEPPVDDVCPVAPPTSFPEAVTYDVRGRVAAGTYRWWYSGTVDVAGVVKVPFEFLSSRKVGSAEPSVPGATAYEMEQQLPSFTEANTFEVRLAPNALGAPTDGIYLTRMRYREGEIAIDFEPHPALAPRLVVLPVPARPEPVQATVVDTEHNVVFQFNGTFEGRTPVRLNACGEIVEAWKFSGSRVVKRFASAADLLRSQSGQPVEAAATVANETYELSFTPQYGALVVGDRTTIRTTAGAYPVTIDTSSVIAGLQGIGQK